MEYYLTIKKVEIFKKKKKKNHQDSRHLSKKKVHHKSESSIPNQHHLDKPAESFSSRISKTNIWNKIK